MDNFNLLSIQFWFFFIIFSLSVYFSFYLPGLFIIRNKEKNAVNTILLSLIVGLVMWGIQGYIFGYLRIRFMTFFYVLFFVWYFWGSHKLFLKEIISFVDKKTKKNIFITCLIIIGTSIQMIPIFGSGMRYADGVRFYGVNAFDGVMHLAFINSIRNHFPPIEPGAYGHALTNYHYWSDLIIADLVRVWQLPIANIFFQYMPLFIAIVTGVAAYKVVRTFGFSYLAGIWSVFFLYFAGDGAYFLMLVVHKVISFTAPAIDNGATQFLNMPHAMAKMIFLVSLISLHNWIISKKAYWSFITIILFASLVGVKIYYGLYSILGYVLIVTVMLLGEYIRQIRQKKSIHSAVILTIGIQKNIIFSVVILGFFAASIYFPPNRNSGGLGYYPLEWAKIFMGPDVLSWNDWWLRHQVYDAANNIRGIVFLDTLAIGITLISIHGSRLIGLFAGKGVYKKLGWEKTIFFIPGILIFHILGLYTLQESGGFNVFNFFVVSTVVLALFSSFVLEKVSILSKKAWFICLLVIVVTVPRVFYETKTGIDKYNNAHEDISVVSHDELEAFMYIRDNTHRMAIVQSHPKNSYDFKTPYVAYFTNRFTFLSGVGMQETHNQPLDEKKKIMNQIFLSDHPQTFATHAKDNGIDYIYIRKNKDEKLLFSIDKNLLKPVFNNKSVVIYKIDL